MRAGVWNLASELQPAPEKATVEVEAESNHSAAVSPAEEPPRLGA